MFLLWEASTVRQFFLKSLFVEAHFTRYTWLP